MEVYSAFLTGTLQDFFAFGVMVVITLGIVVIIHEFGHFLAAKICGVYVEQFAFGFGKELYGFGGGENKTRYSICIWPLGGFVKLFGDVDKDNPIVWDHENDCERRLTPEELEYAFCTKSVWKRIFIVASGPAINILLTLLILVVLFTTFGQRSRPFIINAVAVNSAADEAGIKINDKIIKMDDKAIRRLEDIYDLTWYEKTARPHKYTLSREEEELDITFAAKRVKYENKKGVELKHGQTGMVRMTSIAFDKGMRTINDIDITNQPDRARQIIIESFDQIIEVGIPYKGGEQAEVAHPFRVRFKAEHNQHLFDPNHEYYDRAFLVDHKKTMYRVRLGLLEATSRSLFLMREGIVNSYKVIHAGLKGKNDDPIVSGVTKIGQKVGGAVKAGFYDYIILVAVFSFMIGIINLLPIPVLDGGYLLFLFYEILRGKPVSTKFQGIAMIVGLFILIGIMIFANVSDLLSLFYGSSSD